MKNSYSLFMKTQEDEALVLRLRSFRDFDSLVTLATKNSGKHTFIARGIKRGKSKLAGILQPFSHISFEGKISQGLGSLRRAELLHAPPPTDPILFFCTEVLEKLLVEGKIDSSLWTLLCDISQVTKIERIPCPFLIKLLSERGYLPSFSICHHCSNKFFNQAYWQEKGDIWCQKCFQEKNYSPHAALSLSFEEIKILSFWQQKSLLVGEKVRPSTKQSEKILSFLLQFLEQEIGLSLKSKEMLW